MSRVLESILRRGKGFLRPAGLAAVLVLCSLIGAEAPARATTGKPAYLWLWYADGNPMPMDGLYCLGAKPPAFTCSYGATVADCQRQVQGYLDAWYADFNLVFTLTRPANGETYYPMVISSDGNWCQQTRTEAGLAPPNGCIDNPKIAAIAFECGQSAHACATIIAHEHGHLVGLEHTDSATDVMNPIIQAPPTAVGFDNKSNPISKSITTDEDPCVLGFQNSYQMMLKTLGAWPSGTTKPSPLGSVPDAGADAGAPDLASDDTVDAPPTGGSVGITTPQIDGGSGVAVVPGFDAISRPSLPSVDTSGAKPSESRGGCGVAPTRPNASTSAAVLLFVLALFACHAGLRRSASGSRRTPAAPAARRPQARHFHA